MIIDAHSHYMPASVAQKTAFFKVGWSDIDRHLTAMDQNGIDKSVLLYPTSDAHLQMNGWQNLCREYNQGIADVLARYPDRFIGAGILPVDNPAAIPAELKRLQDSGFRMLSMASSYEGAYLDDDRFLAVYEFAAKNRWPIHVHSQIINPIGEERLKDPLLSPVLEYVFDVSVCIGKMMMEGTFKKFPQVNFIFAHYGGVLPLVKERFDTTYSMLRQRGFVKDLGQLPSEYFKNIYFDTSGSKSVASLLCALEMTDAKHIIFGSDFPANQKYTEAKDTVKGCRLSRQEETQILGFNALEILHLK